MLHAQLDPGCSLLQLDSGRVSRFLRSRTWSIEVHFIRTVTFSACTTPANWTAKDLRISTGGLVGPLGSSAVEKRTFGHRFVSFEIALAKCKIVHSEAISVRIVLNNVVLKYLGAIRCPALHRCRRKLMSDLFVVEWKHLAVKMLLETTRADDLIFIVVVGSTGWRQASVNVIPVIYLVEMDRTLVGNERFLNLGGLFLPW